MIPETTFEIVDESQLATVASATVDNPLNLMIVSADKGPEDFKVIKDVDTFNAYYGDNPSFARHGQPLLQAANIINNGGALFIKRIVADDATLANIGIIATVKKVSVQKTDVNGNALYTDATTGAETTVAAGNTPVMVNKCSIKWDCKSVENIKTLAGAVSAIDNLGSTTGPDEFVYPLAVIADNGRGVSNKKFRISPLYSDSRYLSYVRYSFQTIEDDNIAETINFVLDPDIQESSTNKSLDSMVNGSSKRLSAKFFDSQYYNFIAKVAEISGLTADYLKSVDIIFGKTVKEANIDNLVIDSTGFNLSYTYGVGLENGNNGAFGLAPFGTTAWETQALKAVDGTYTKDIYDVDNYKLDLIPDANYPLSVKNALIALADFREDVFVLTDIGIGYYVQDDIITQAKQITNSKFCSKYYNTYDVIDPYSKKQITVTITYSLATLLITHFRNGRTRPFAGQQYGVTIPEAIAGTINHLPKKTPVENEKQTFIDNRINYVSYYDEVPVVETLYTSQNDYTQLSFSNNIIAIQEVVKAVRTQCPKIRYSFLTSDDLETYQRDVQNVLDNYTANFKTLKMSYANDATMIENKAYYAIIQCSFKDFVQTEVFKLYALAS